MSYLSPTSFARWSKKVDTMALAKISGHKDINELMTYYRQTATQIAERMGLFEGGRAVSRAKGDKVTELGLTPMT